MTLPHIDPKLDPADVAARVAVYFHNCGSYAQDRFIEHLHRSAVLPTMEDQQEAPGQNKEAEKYLQCWKKTLRELGEVKKQLLEIVKS